MPYRVDSAGVATLFDLHWTRRGWRRDGDGPDDVKVVHRELANIDQDEVAEAFLCSLTSNRLDLRSALGSFAVARHLPRHRHAGRHGCSICGVYEQPQTIELNVLNFERIKWGGVRRSDLRYIAFDLQQFKRAPRTPPSAADIAALRAILEALDSMPAGTTAATASDLLKVAGSNKNTRAVLLDILGVCGILQTQTHRGYSDGFVRADARELPPVRFVEREYPVCWRRSDDGVNWDQARRLFRQL